MKSTKTECCTELQCESGLRNNYFEGKRLTADSFRVEQTYAVERRRLLNRAVFGWGVVYGFAITASRQSGSHDDLSRGALKIGPGLALDECGRELLQVRETALTLDDLIVLDEKGSPAQSARIFSSSQSQSERDCWLLRVHYAEQKSGPVTVKDSCSCEHKEWDHTCETVRYSLQRVPCSQCCEPFECELCCDCGRGPCCDDEERHKRGGCQCLCEHFIDLPVPECGPLCEIEDPCAEDVRVDLRHGVPLACIDMSRDDCERGTFGAVDRGGPRRLVKRNDLLFDLIRGCDLTRIEEIGWWEWHREKELVPFQAFSDAFGDPEKSDKKHVTEKFWVRFSGPVRKKTLRADCVAMTVISAEHESGWWQSLRVPILGLDTNGFFEPGDPEDCVRGGRVIVDRGWVKDAVRSSWNRFRQGCRVEIEIRGDFIVDCNGQAVDANAIGLLQQGPFGNGAPGGTFLSTFRVEPLREAPYRTDDDSAERHQGVSS